MGLIVSLINQQNENVVLFDPLAREKGVSVNYIEAAKQIADQDVLIIPGLQDR